MSEAVELARGYPPAPWELRGQVYGAMWLVPREQCTVELDPAFEPLVLAGRVVVLGGFVNYQPGSVLVYREFMAALGVRLRNRWRPGFTVTHIWVDDEQSLRGGRALWGVPKEMASFQWPAEQGVRWELRAEAQGQELISGRFERGLGLSAGLRVPIPLPDLQLLEGRVHASVVTFSTRPRLMRGELTVPSTSPLASLGIAGRRPTLCYAMEDFQVHLEAARPLR